MHSPDALVRLSLTVLGLAVLALLGAACARAPAVDRSGRLVPRTPPGVILDQREEPYAITASSGREVIAALGPLGPRPGGVRYPGQHEWRIRWEYHYQPEVGRCRVTQATVYLTSIVVLPTWSPPADVDTAVATEWARYQAALAVHEDGHRAIALSGAGRVRQALIEVQAGSCALIADAVRDAATPLVERTRREEAQYDATTHHGATQGASFRLRGRAVRSVVMDEGCVSTELSELPSPSLRLNAVVYERDCGPQTDTTTNVAILELAQHALPDTGNVLVVTGPSDPGFRGGPAVKILWATDTLLLVRYAKRARLVRSAQQVQGVSIMPATFE